MSLKGEGRRDHLLMTYQPLYNIFFTSFLAMTKDLKCTQEMEENLVPSSGHQSGQVASIDLWLM